MTDEKSPDPLAPLATFEVGDWRCQIRQLVSGPLYFDCAHRVSGSRAGRLPVGMNVEQAKEEVTRLLTAPLPE
jgi:hypothetical protein